MYEIVYSGIIGLFFVCTKKRVSGLVLLGPPPLVGKRAQAPPKRFEINYGAHAARALASRGALGGTPEMGRNGNLLANGCRFVRLFSEGKHEI